MYFFRFTALLFTDIRRHTLLTVCMAVMYLDECKTICRNYLCTKKFILVIVVFFLNQIFSLFPIVKMNSNYAEICRVGNLEADFQQVLLVHFFLKFSQYCCQTSIIQIQ